MELNIWGNFRIFLTIRFYELLESKSSKTAVFAIFEAAHIVNLVDFSPKENTNIYQNLISEPLNVLKWQILHLQNPQI